MNKCEPWTVAAVYLMQCPNGSAHYTNIVNYIIETELTEFVEKSAAASQTINETLKQKVINGRAIFNSDGNGYYTLNSERAMRKSEQIQGVIQCLKDKGLTVNVRSLEGQQNKPATEDDSTADNTEKLSNDARKLCEETRKLSDEIMNLSDEVTKLSDENKNFRQETGMLRQENQQLKEKLDSIKQLCE